MADIRKDGISQGDLVTYLGNVKTIANEFKADFNACLAKLDSDVLVGDTDYASSLAIAAADVSVTKIKADGIHQKDLSDVLAAITTLATEAKADYNGLLAKLDADSGVNDANYASLHTTAASVPSVSNISGLGMGYGEVFSHLSACLTFFNELKADYNAVLAKLDLDSGVTDTNYASSHATATSDLSLSV